MKPARLLAVLLAAAALTLAGATTATAGPPAGAVPIGGGYWARHVGAKADCWGTWHARPTGTGSYRDPCAGDQIFVYGGGGEALFRLAVGVNFWWSASGGPHITDARGEFRVTRYSDDILQVRADSLNLGRVGFGYSGVIATSVQTPLTASNDALVVTPWTAGRGCGDWGNRIGSGSYALNARGYGNGRWDAGTWYGQQTLLDPPSYFLFAGDGTC